MEREREKAGLDASSDLQYIQVCEGEGHFCFTLATLIIFLIQ